MTRWILRSPHTSVIKTRRDRGLGCPLWIIEEYAYFPEEFGLAATLVNRFR
jgi:hypothetical protein